MKDDNQEQLTVLQEDFPTTFKNKLIYAFTINDDSHKGLLKIGDASIEISGSFDRYSPNCKELNQAALERIKKYTNTAGNAITLIHTELAIRVKQEGSNNIIVPFRDYDVHRVLKASHIENVVLPGTSGKEWYKVEKETLIQAISAVKDGRATLKAGEAVTFTPIVFRPEQRDAIDQTVARLKKGTRFLWNAKMRFGKTVSALQVIRELGYKKTIIITHRPVVDEGWYEDFNNIFHDTDEWIYGSKKKGSTLSDLLEQKKKFIYFASIQDLRGSKKVGGKHQKNDSVYNLAWDFVIIDEAHEGTQTSLGKRVIDELMKADKKKHTRLLALSGTPFNIQNEFGKDEVYTWDYVMEQHRKKTWDLEHFGEANPYAALPEMRMYTYDLGNILKADVYQEVEDKAFNFAEFFRTWTGSPEKDGDIIHAGQKIGDFIHEKDVYSFLNLLTKEDDNSKYPFSTESYRQLFKHTLWMVPGVPEAKALKELMEKHSVFGCGAFKIINVAGGEVEAPLDEVKESIKDAVKNETYTITLSCGKLTTGVTVPEWSAVFYLSGTFATAASNYLQTIFRVQSPGCINGKVKEVCYVFDFAPDRTLRMVSEAAKISRKPGISGGGNREGLRSFLNFCPVISVDGSEMKLFRVDNMLQQLKRAYADRAVRTGFEDTSIYNQNLLNLTDLDLKEFEKLKAKIGTTKANLTINEIPINDTGLTDIENEPADPAKKPKKKELTPEEKARLEELKKRKAQRQNAISILRGISIRIPLLIYGADIKFTDDITAEDLLRDDIVDKNSWEEFMPAGVTKQDFKKFLKYYDTDIFIAAGKKIRRIVAEADELPPTERVKKITHLFSWFKNPDKETVLTPWRVVNMHMSDCLGGWDFWDEQHKKTLDEPRFVNQGKVTEHTLNNGDAIIMEINSKTGLYPLYLAYSIFRSKCPDISNVSVDKQRVLWDEVVKSNVYVICKTDMAKSITKRTLLGYRNIEYNAHAFKDLLMQFKEKPEKFRKQIVRGSFWDKNEVKKLNINAIVGNPPYQIMDNGYRTSATPVYNYFVEQSINLAPQYVSMIIPARWYSGGKGLDKFREFMLNDDSLRVIHDFPEPADCFPSVQIKGGLLYFLWDRENKGNCAVYTHRGNYVGNKVERPLLEPDSDTFIRFNEAISILYKVRKLNESSFAPLVSSRKPFGLDTQYRGKELGDILLYQNGGKSYIDYKDVVKNKEYVSMHKVYVPESGSGSDVFPHPIIGKPFVGQTETACTETYLMVGPFASEVESENVVNYMMTKFFRFLVMLRKPTQHASQNVYQFVPVQDFSHTWTDEMLYKKYNLTDEEIAFIDSMIKPMDEAQAAE